MLFNQTIIPSRRAHTKTPAISDLSRLAIKLNCIREEIEADKIQAQVKPLANLRAMECEVLERRLAEIARMATHPGFREPEEMPAISKLLEETMKNLRICALVLRDIPRPDREPQRTLWRWHLIGLIQIFREAMQANNKQANGRTAGTGTAKDTPLTRFICAVIPDLTGETVTPENVTHAVSTVRQQVKSLPRADGKY